MAVMITPATSIQWCSERTTFHFIGLVKKLSSLQSFTSTHTLILMFYCDTFNSHKTARTLTLDTASNLNSRD